MRPSQRTAVLDAALRVLGSADGDTITLDAVAREAGMTKAGLMYHFPTREDLMLAIVDHAAASLEAAMLDALGVPVHEASPSERVRAYAVATGAGSTSRGEWATWTEAAYRPDLAAPWVERMGPWFELPDELSGEERARLTVARLAADGLWTAEATGVFPPGPADRDRVLEIVASLTASTGEADR